MKIQLWYCNSNRQWRWVLTDDSDKSVQESGQQVHLRDAMNDVANTVEYVLDCKLEHPTAEWKHPWYSAVERQFED